MRRQYHIQMLLLQCMMIFVILPLFAFMLFLCINLKKRVDDSAVSSAQAYAQQIADNTQRMLEVSNYVVSSLMMDTDVLLSLKQLQSREDSYAQYRQRADLSQKLSALENSVLNAVNGNLLIVTPSGDVISSVNILTGKEGLRYACALMDKHPGKRTTMFDPDLESLFSRILLSDTFHPYQHLYFCRSFYSYSGQFLGYALVQLGTDNLWDGYDSSRFTSGTLSILDQNGILHLSQHKDPQRIRNLFAEADLSSLNDASKESGIHDDTYYHAILLENSPLVLFFAQPISELYSAGSMIVRSTLTLCLLLTITCIIAMVAISHLITRPITILIRNLEDQSVDSLHVDAGKTSLKEMEDLVSSYNHAGKRISELISQVRKESALREKANYDMLISQISPHFVFNTVNAIKMTANSSGDSRTVEALTALGNVLRSVYSHRGDVVSIGWEMQLLTSYVKIMRLRFGSEFSYIDIVPTEFYGYEIPAFSLQPIVENAILHGVRNMGAGQIVVSAVENGDVIEFSIFNNGETPDPAVINQQLIGQCITESKTTGIGLSNVHTRIHLLYGQEYGIRLNTEVTAGCDIRLLIPRREAIESDD